MAVELRQTILMVRPFADNLDRKRISNVIWFHEQSCREGYPSWNILSSVLDRAELSQFLLIRMSCIFMTWHKLKT